MKEKLNNWKFLLLLIAVFLVVALGLLAFLVGDQKEAEISVDAESVTLKIGDTWELPVKVAEGQSMPEVLFEVENASIASVTKTGQVTGLREGETQINLTTKGGQTASVDVTVAAEEKSGKVIYLTYEGGPSMEVTPALLDLLAKYDAKATFFPYGQEAEGCPTPVRQAAAFGHTIGVFTYSAEYTGIYGSLPAYVDDFMRTEQIIKSITEQQPEYWRFPGGSSNSNMSEETREAILEEEHSRGYVCVDWNCYIDDLSDEEPDAKSMAKMGIQTIDQAISMGQIPVVRMYDRADVGDVVKVTKKIIKHYKKKGYEFKSVSDYEGTDLIADQLVTDD